MASLQAWTMPYTEPNDHGSTRWSTLVALRDDDGAVGWGEAVTILEEAARATTALLRALAPVLAGAPVDPPGLRAALAERSWWYGTHGGLSGFAVAALDCAAWDLAGRRADRPTHELLGPLAHDSLPTIVSTHATLADLREQSEVLARWRAERGAEGVKVGFGKRGEADLGRNADRDVAFVRELRSALGPEARVLVDIGAAVRWSVPEAIERSRAFSEHGTDWIEEPLGADDPDGYARLHAAATGCRIAYGEREWTRAGMDRIVDSGSLDVLGIDAGRAGGLTDFVGAAAHAAGRGVQVNAHAFAGPVSYAAGLAASFVAPNCAQFEVAPLRNSQFEQLAEVPRTHGPVTPLPGRGLGVEIDEAAVRRFAAD